MLHRVRLILMRQRTQLSNALRSHLAEFGIVSPIGRVGLDRLLTIVADTDDGRVPAEARASLEMLAVQLEGVKAQILENDRRIIASARATEVGRRLLEVPGIGPVLASAFVASVADPSDLQIRARSCGMDRACTAAELKRRQGAPWLASPKPATAICARCSMVGAMAVIRYAQRNSARRPWLVAAHGSPPNEGRGYRARQQDRPNGVGADDQRGTLPRSAGRLSNARLAALTRLGRARRELMHKAG